MSTDAIRRITPYSDFAEGDYVTRDGTDVHQVRDLEDGDNCANFVCVWPPATGWTEVGEVEWNLCRRYSRVLWDPAKGGQPTMPPSHSNEPLEESACVRKLPTF